MKLFCLISNWITSWCQAPIGCDVLWYRVRRHSGQNTARNELPSLCHLSVDLCSVGALRHILIIPPSTTGWGKRLQSRNGDAMLYHFATSSQSHARHVGIVMPRCIFSSPFFKQSSLARIFCHLVWPSCPTSESGHTTLYCFCHLVWPSCPTSESGHTTLYCIFLPSRLTVMPSIRDILLVLKCTSAVN